MLELSTVPTPEQRTQWERDGYLVLRGFIPPQEVSAMIAHFMAMHAAGVPGQYEPPAWKDCDGDPLKRYPRILQPHRFDAFSKDSMIDARLEPVLRALFGEEPLAAQSMLYFKPPGARGQALHQDNLYLRVTPGTCIAAWLALDGADEGNGGMFVVPGSQTTDLQCPHVADMSVSFTSHEVDVPSGMATVPTDLAPGDALFFNGSLIHGSYPNTSTNRFRRSFICHYVPNSTREMAHYYYPLHTFSGTALTRDVAEGQGGVCGPEQWAALNVSSAKPTRESLIH